MATPLKTPDGQHNVLAVLLRELERCSSRRLRGQFGRCSSVDGLLFLRLLQAFADSQGRLQGLSGAPGLTRLVAMPLFEVAAFVMMLVVPLITMRLVAEERRTGTLVLLLGSPVSSTGIVIGKFLVPWYLCFVLLD